MPVAFNTQISGINAVSNYCAPVSVAAAGSTQATATSVTDSFILITNNTAANGIILPILTAGPEVWIFPQLVTNAPLVYPPVGGSINAGTVNAGLATPARKATIFKAIDGLGNYVVNISA
jgi:hypothetical protein